MNSLKIGLFTKKMLLLGLKYKNVLLLQTFPNTNIPSFLLF